MQQTPNVIAINTICEQTSARDRSVVRYVNCSVPAQQITTIFKTGGSILQKIVCAVLSGHSMHAKRCCIYIYSNTVKS